MARAKRTDRAEARRKYRAYLQAQTEAEAEAGVAAEAEESEPAPRRSLFSRRSSLTAAPSTEQPAPRPRPAAAAPATPAAPMGFVRAIGAAYKPIHYRDDLRYIPTMFRTSIGLWLGIGLPFVGVAILLADRSTDDFLSQIALLAVPTPLGPAMIAGILSQRAGWLAGVFSGIAAGAGAIIILASQPDRVVTASGAHVTASEAAGLGIQYLLFAICFGALIGSLSAWYRRFLNLAMGPNQRNQQSKRATRSSGRPAPKRTK